MSSTHILTTAIRSGVLSEIKLIFEDSTKPSDEGPLELVIPLSSHMCNTCQNLSKIKLKRPFTFSSIPFSFDISDYPANLGGWTALATGVYDWFRISTQRRNSDEWRWAVNFFWICYVASTPRFPATTNTTIHWDPAVIPLSGEFISTRSVAMAVDEYIPWDQLTAALNEKLLEWNGLREGWILHGVDVDEYRGRIVAHEF